MAGALESKSKFAHSLEVVSSPDSGDSSLDIVTVHGFGGHNCRSWTTDIASDQKECMWLKDLLPRHLSTARVMEFTYESIATGRSSILSSRELTEIAQLLLKSLLSKREDTVFFGTPHRALSISSWEDLIFNVLSLYPQSVADNLNMATQVESFSRAVERLSGDFLSLSIRRCIINVYQGSGRSDDGNTTVSCALSISLFPFRD
ncbi:hypothetical protein ABW21_db0203074 [Orbilia brochopaga]|nr:hypothetical protein ABW21_db0203074 [Drechslerella brochopaga]